MQRAISYKCSNRTTITDEDGVETTYENCTLHTLVVRNLLGSHLFELLMGALAITNESLTMNIDTTPEIVYERMFDYGK